jgi:cell division protein FtsW
MTRETMAAMNLVLALLLIGILMVYSASAVQTYAANEAAATYLSAQVKRQLLWVGIGIGALLAAANFDYHHFRKRLILYLLAGASIVLLLLVLRFGEERRGGMRWLAIWGFSFQPSEFAKLAVLVFLAVKLAENQEHRSSFLRGFAPPLLLAGAVSLLILLEQDLGGPIVLGSLALIMVLMAGGRWLHVLSALIPGVLIVALLCMTTPYRFARLKSFLDPWEYRETFGFQLLQSLAAFAHGSVWGQGPGASEQKLFYLPDAHSDFIFAVWGEEMGLVGSVLLVLLFLALLLVAFRIAICAPDMLGALLAGGVGALIALQAAFNMAVTTGLAPTKGLALPFISAGGSALITNLALVGILLNVGFHASEDQEKQGALRAAS